MGRGQLSCGSGAKAVPFSLYLQVRELQQKLASLEAQLQRAAALEAEAQEARAVKQQLAAEQITANDWRERWNMQVLVL